MKDPDLAEQYLPRRGVAIKLLGVVLIILGVLDSMLLWRGGFALSEPFILMIAAGILVYSVGAIGFGAGRDLEPPPHPGEDQPVDREIDLSQRSGQADPYHSSEGRVLQQTLQVEQESSGSEQPRARSGASGSA